MSEVIAHPPGTVCWVELATTDAEAARLFYGPLFGWTGAEIPMPDGSPYTLLQQDGHSSAGLYRLSDEQQRDGVPPHWMIYTAVEDADAAAEAARSNGGTVLVEPMSVPNVGRMVFLQDCEGASFAILNPSDSAPGLGSKDAPGGLCWTELSSRDPEGAEAFYGAVLGWDARPQETPGGPYTMFSADGEDVGGMVQMNEEWGEMPAAWMPYFGIADIDAALKQIPSLGGEVAMGPVEAEGVGRFAVVQDPQGAFLSIIQLESFG